jgi:hypothetical protein
MPSAKLVIGSAAATAALGVRVSRSLYGRWHLLPEQDRRRIEGLAEDLKHKALELRGARDTERAGKDLRVANETLAAALVETAHANPEISDSEVRELREDLRRELERLAGGGDRGAAGHAGYLRKADIKASRTPQRTTARQG